MTPILGVTASQISGHLFTSPYWILTEQSSNWSYQSGIALDSSLNIHTVNGMEIEKFNTNAVIEWQRLPDNMSGSYGFSDSIQVDASGNVYAVGTSNDAIIGTIIVKYNSSGAIQWMRKLSNINLVAGTSIALDSSANIYIAGYYTNTSSGDNAFIAKYNTSGTIQWQRSIADTNPLGQGDAYDYAWSLAADSSGNVYVAGEYLTGGSLGNFNATFSGFISKYNTSGTIQWQRAISGGIETRCFALALDSSANVYVGGSYSDTNIYQSFIAKYNTSGTIQWQRALKNSPLANMVTTSIAVDSSGNVYNGGWYEIENQINNQSMFIAKYNTSGVIQWQRSIVKTGTVLAQANGLKSDSSNNIYICGVLNGITDYCQFILKLPNDGSKTGTYAGVTYSASAFTDVIGPLTSSTISNTLSTTSFVSATQTATDTEASNSFGKVSI